MEFEVIIIGGGPAGLSAALVLGRSRVRTLVLNMENPRNLVTSHSHGFLTQDGVHPSEILHIAKVQLTKYKNVVYKKERAMGLALGDARLQVKTDREIYTSKRVVIATGHNDNISDIGIDGLSDVYGISVYPCPFCDGFEMADKKLAVLGDAVMAPMFAKTIFHWSKDIIVFTNGQPVADKDLISQLNSKGVLIMEEKIKRLISTEGKLIGVEFMDGSIVQREGGFLADTKSSEGTDFAKKMNIPTEEGPFGMPSYQVDEHKETKIVGLYIIGDARTGWSGIAASVAEGSEVAAAITHQIIEENWK